MPGEHLRNARLNITNFLRSRLYQDFGMKELIERFYNSIRREIAADRLPGNHFNRANHGRNLRPNLSRADDR